MKDKIKEHLFEVLKKQFLHLFKRYPKSKLTITKFFLHDGQIKTYLFDGLHIKKEGSHCVSHVSILSWRKCWSPKKILLLWWDRKHLIKKIVTNLSITHEVTNIFVNKMFPHVSYCFDAILSLNTLSKLLLSTFRFSISNLKHNM